jgi:hypothetical protein
MVRANEAPTCCESTVIQTLAPPREVAQRIFSQADWTYVTQEAAPIKRLFIQERRALALQWLRHTRQQASQMIYCRRAYAPSHHQRTIDRLKLVGDYTLFLSVCAVLFLLIQWGNPIRAEKLAAWILAKAERFYAPLT